MLGRAEVQFYLETRLRWIVCFTPQSIYHQEESPLAPICTAWSLRFSGEKFSDYTGIESRLSCNLVTTLTEPSLDPWTEYTCFHTIGTKVDELKTSRRSLADHGLQSNLHTIAPRPHMGTSRGSSLQLDHTHGRDGWSLQLDSTPSFNCPYMEC